MRCQTCLLLWEVAIAIALGCALAQAQQLSPDEVRTSSHAYAPPPMTFRAEANEVQVAVVVRDSRGNPISGLQKSDFQISDNGKSQSLTSVDVVRVDAARSSAPFGSATPTRNPKDVESSRSAAPLPDRYVALYFDDIHSLPGDLRRMQVAAERLLKEASGARDRFAVFTASAKQHLDFTQDREKLVETIDAIRSNPHEPESYCPRLTSYEAYLIVNGLDPNVLRVAMGQAHQCLCGGESMGCGGGEDRVAKAAAVEVWTQTLAISRATLASIESVVRYLGHTNGTRVLVFGSSGFHSGDLEEQVENIINLALRMHVVINSLDAKGLYAEEPDKTERELNASGAGPGGAKGALDTMVQQIQSLGDRLATATAAMSEMAYSTGGLFFTNNNDLAAGYDQMALAPEVSYVLHFSPEPFLADGKFHRLRLRVDAGDHHYLQVRPGYFAVSPDVSAQEKIDAAMSNDNQVRDFPVTVTTVANDGQVLVKFHVDVRGLPFQDKKGRHVERLSFVAALFDGVGNCVNGKEAEMDLALKSQTYKHFENSGITGTLTLPANPGSYRLRVVTQEMLKGKTAAESQLVEITSSRR